MPRAPKQRPSPRELWWLGTSMSGLVRFADPCRMRLALYLEATVIIIKKLVYALSAEMPYAGCHCHQGSAGGVNYRHGSALLPTQRSAQPSSVIISAETE